MRISDWSSDVCSSDLDVVGVVEFTGAALDAPGPFVILDMHERLDCLVQCIPCPHCAQEGRRFAGAEQAQDAVSLGHREFALQIVVPVSGQALLVEGTSVKEAQTGRASSRDRVCQYV